MRGMIRGIVQAVAEGVIKRLAASGLAGERFANREYMQHYGFTSRPLSGAEVILVREGNHIVAIASDDRRYRIALDAGEVALYDDQGQAVHLKRGNAMQVTCTGKLTADVADEAEVNTQRAVVNASVSTTVTSPQVTVVASAQVTLQTPLVACTQDVLIGGNLAVAGNISFGGGMSGTGASGSGDIATPGEIADGTRKISEDRAIYTGHRHPGDSGGTTGVPDQPM